MISHSLKFPPQPTSRPFRSPAPLFTVPLSGRTAAHKPLPVLLTQHWRRLWPVVVIRHFRKRRELHVLHFPSCALIAGQGLLFFVERIRLRLESPRFNAHPIAVRPGTRTNRGSKSVRSFSVLKRQPRAATEVPPTHATLLLSSRSSTVSSRPALRDGIAGRVVVRNLNQRHSTGNDSRRTSDHRPRVSGRIARSGRVVSVVETARCVSG